MKKKTKFKLETSKKILLVSYLICIILTVLTIVSVIAGWDAVTMGTITGFAYGEVAVSNAFYFNKAKKENALKIAMSCVKMDPAKVEKVAKMTEVIGNIN